MLRPNGSRLSCGCNARGRKVEERTGICGSEATQFFLTCERPAASSACQAAPFQRRFDGAWSSPHPHQDLHGTDRYCQDGTEQDLWPLKDRRQAQSIYAPSRDRG